MKMAFNKSRGLLGEDGKVFVLENIPLNYSADLIINYVESTLDVDVEAVKLFPFLQGRALVYLEDKLKDFSKAEEKIAKENLESKAVKLLVASREAAVVVNSIDFRKLSREFLCLYFESEFADGCDIIETSVAWPELKMAVVYFHPLQRAVVEKILESSDLVPLPSEDYHISVHPCYNNFHEYIGQQISDEIASTRTVANIACDYAGNRENKTEEKENDDGDSEEEETEEDTDEGGEKDVKHEGKNKRDDDKSETDSSEESNADESDEKDVTREGKDKRDDDESETDSSEESSSDGEYAKVGSILNQRLNRDPNKDATVASKQRSAAVRGGFRGRGGQSMKGGLTTLSSRKESYEQSDTVTRKSSFSKDSYHKDKDFENKNESQAGKNINMTGRGKSRGRFHDEDFCAERKSEMSKINNMKPHNFRGRGGPVFRLSGHGDSFETFGLPVCHNRFDVPEMHSHWNLDAPVFKPGINKQHSTNYTALDHIGQETTSSITAGRNPPEETLDASFSQNLPGNKTVFKKVELESQDKSVSQLATKDARIKELEERLAEKEQLKQCIEKIEMTIWQEEFLLHCFGTFTDCHIHFDGRFAVVEGTLERVKEQQLKLLKELTKLKEELLDISPAVYSILSNEQGKQYLLSLNSNQLNGAKVFLQERCLMVAAKNDRALKDAMDFLNGRLNYKETITTEAKIPTEKLRSQKLAIESKFLVRVSWNDMETEIYVEGIKDDVFESVREIKTLVLEHVDHEKSFTVSGLHAKLLHTYCEDRIKQYLQGVDIIDYSSTEAHIAVKFKGDRKVTQQAHRNLKELQTKVTVKSWNLRCEFKKPEELMLIAKGFASEKMKKKISTFEAAKKCIVSHKLSGLESFSIRTSKKGQQAHSTHRSTSTHRRQFKVATTEQRETKLTLQINNTCQLVVKPYGDITKETSDVLVSVLTTHFDLRKTRVGQAFNKVCTSLWKTLQVEHEAHPTDIVLTTKGPFKFLKCQAICHIVLTPWDPNSPAQLTTAIQSVISNAVALGAKSISFPVLGCGRAFKFPPSDVAEIALASIKSSNFGQSLQKVVLLAPDAELFSEFKNRASKHFQLLPAKDEPVQVVGATSSLLPDITISGDEDDGSEDSDDEETVVEEIHDSQKSGNAEITIAAQHNSGMETMWAELRKTIEKVCLHTHCFNQDIVSFWPKDSRHRILQEAKKLCVFVEKSSKTKKPGFIIKGEKERVEKILKTIKEELTTISSHLPKKRIKSSEAPKRGTCDFMKYAAESDEVFPSYWKLNKSKNQNGLLKKLTSALSSHKSEDYLVNVDSETKDAIKILIAKTWDPNFVGHGNDAAGLSHTKIKVTDVKRIENVGLFELYSAQRKSLFRKMCSKHHICPDIKKLPGSKGRIITTEILESFMKEELYYEVNEHYLFHGTKSPGAIASNGIDPRVSSEGGMFGKGIYTAEKFIKSDQYTDSRAQRSPPGTTLHMILARVLLGNVFLCDDKHASVAHKQSTKLTRPPCVQCKNDKCACSNQELYDSVVGDGKWIFREFVVYERSHCYPEYLISYQRA